MGYVIYPSPHGRLRERAIVRKSFYIVNHSNSKVTHLVSCFEGGKSDNLKELIENSIAWAISETLKGEKDRFLMIEELQALLADEKLMKELSNDP